MIPHVYLHLAGLCDELQTSIKTGLCPAVFQIFRSGGVRPTWGFHGFLAIFRKLDHFTRLKLCKLSKSQGNQGIQEYQQVELSRLRGSNRAHRDSNYIYFGVEVTPVFDFSLLSGCQNTCIIMTICHLFRQTLNVVIEVQSTD